MKWMDRLPPDLSELEQTQEGFRGHVSIPVDDDGYFGRECPSCALFFKMEVGEYEALPEELELTCPYCGHREEHSAFMTTDQVRRTSAAMEAVAEQYVHDAVNEIFGSTFGKSAARAPRGSGVTITYTPGSPPPPRQLPTYVEERVRRILECDGCRNHYAVYGASAFCPVCGVRPEIENVTAAIERARTTLALEDQLDPGQREDLRAAGVFDGFATEAIKQIVGLFEVFADEQFRLRVVDPEPILRGRGAVFQRLEDSSALFVEEVGFSLHDLVGTAVWERLKEVFEQRHVLVHRNGRVDQRYLEKVPESRVGVGQRLVIMRYEAEQALADLELLVNAIASRQL